MSFKYGKSIYFTTMVTKITPENSELLSFSIERKWLQPVSLDKNTLVLNA